MSTSRECSILRVGCAVLLRRLLLLLSRRVPVVSVGDDFSLPPKTAWLLCSATAFRTGRGGFRGLPLRTPTARSMHHTTATQRLCWRKISSSCFSGFTWRTRFARHTLVAGVLRTGWHAWRSRSLLRGRVLRGADRRRPSHSSVTTEHESARRRRRAPVDAPRPVSERKPRSRISRVSALGADHGNRQRGKNVGVEEAHLRPPGGRRWQPPHVNTAGVAFRSGQGHSMGVLARVTLVTAVGGCVRD